MHYLNTWFRNSSTRCLTISEYKALNFLCMGEEEARTVPAGPLARHFHGKDRGTKTAAARALGISPQLLNNWLKRGIPLAQVPVVAKFLKMADRDEYMAAAGIKPAIPYPAIRFSQTDEASLLRVITGLWPRIPVGSQQALAILARDVSGAANRPWDGKERRTSQYGSPGQEPYTRRKSDLNS